MKILDVGCGDNKNPSAIGIDRLLKPGVDIVHNLDEFPWPLKDNSFDLIICKHIIEHLDDVVKTMEEIHRVGRPGAKVVVETPHFSSFNSFRDPTHKWHFSYDTFDYFSGNSLYPVYTKCRFFIRAKKYVFINRWDVGNIISKIAPKFYESHFVWLFPPYSMYFELEVVKKLEK